jgi:predicted membrane protein
MDSKVFWGVLIILLGFSLIINHVFKIDIPFFKVVIALIIIYFGVNLLMDSFGIKWNKKGEHSSVFSGQKLHPDLIAADEEYNAVFGSIVVDLENTRFEGKDIEIEVNAVFGSARVYLPKNSNIKIKSTGVFGSVRTPDGGKVNFGENQSSLGDSNANQNVTIEANAVFGNVRFFQP